MMVFISDGKKILVGKGKIVIMQMKIYQYSVNTQDLLKISLVVQTSLSVYDKYDIFHEGGGDNESSHHNLREKLVTHFCKQHKNGNVEWLK